MKHSRGIHHSWSRRTRHVCASCSCCSTSSCVGRWECWGRHRSDHFPCCRRPWWHLQCCPSWDPHSNRLSKSKRAIRSLESLSLPSSPAVNFCLSLTALPFWVAELEIPACACWVLAGSIRVAHVLQLAGDGLECGIHLHVVLPDGAGWVISPHVSHGVWALLMLGQSSEGRHVDARAWGTRRTRGSSVTGRTLGDGDRERGDTGKVTICWVQSVLVRQAQVDFLV